MPVTATEKVKREGFKLTNDAAWLLQAVASQCGVSKTDIIEMAIRDIAKKLGVKLK